MQERMIKSEETKKKKKNELFGYKSSLLIFEL